MDKSYSLQANLGDEMALFPKARDSNPQTGASEVAIAETCTCAAFAALLVTTLPRLPAEGGFLGEPSSPPMVNLRSTNTNR
jgi:hypothetical protein